MLKMKLIVATALALMAMGVVASTAAAENNVNGMPFWWHREASQGQAGQGKGTKLTETLLEQFKASSQEAKLKGKVVGVPVEITCALDATGSIFNNKSQGKFSDSGQIKVGFKFYGCHEGKKSGEECKVTVEQFATKAHILWKWDGSLKQLGPGNQRKLGQTPDGYVQLLPLDNVPKGEGTFTSLTFANGTTGTCLATGTFNVTGDTSFSIKPEQEGEFSKAFTLSFPGPALQHYQIPLNPQNQEFLHVGFAPGLRFGGNPAVFEVEVKGGFEGQGGKQQEVALYEEEP